MADRFPFVRSEGALLPSSFLARLAAREKGIDALGPEAYHLEAKDRLSEAIASAWNRLQPAWAAFSKLVESAGPQEALVGPTREKWLLPLFAALGWGRLAPARPREVGERSYPVSHAWSDVPIHLVGAGVELDVRTAGVAGAARSSPHGLVQELLNRDERALWGLVTNGRKLRLLRDSASLARQAYVEFDLEGIFAAEAFGDFSLLWLLAHPSRFEGERPEKTPLERWARAAAEQGTRALDTLRQGVEQAIAALGQGFLAHPGNTELRGALESGALVQQDYYRELLREVYRLIFLATAEDRGLLHSPTASDTARESYARFFSLARLRRLATRRLGTRHTDLWHGYRQVVAALSSESGRPELGLPALGGFLFSLQATPWLDRSAIANRDLLEAIRALSTTRGEGGRLVAVDWRNLGSEELGSVYEALLELHPRVHLEAASFELATAAGHERKTTGSYYTPSSLIQCLLDSALDPVLDEAAAKSDPAAALLALKVCDPACGSGHFLIAAAHRMAKRLAAVRSGEEEPSPEATRAALRDVIAHCLYGVDINPMAVELCKVNLWLESQDPRFPLSFLDHRIQCGNSLLGTTPKLLDGGIPDEAFTAIEGDDKEVVKKFKKINKQERKDWESGQASFVFERPDRTSHLATDLAALDMLPDHSLADIRAKERRYSALLASRDYEASRTLANAWCAAFVWRKAAASEHPEPITERVFRSLEENPDSGTDRRVRNEIRRLAEEFRFFHWHLVFPEVFQMPSPETIPENEATCWSGGFDCVLGNPPWERLAFEEIPYFTERDPEVARAATTAERRRLIGQLAERGGSLYEQFLADRRRAEAEQVLATASGRFALTAVARADTYALFTELSTDLLQPRGFAGLIVPTGIATAIPLQRFWSHIFDHGRVSSLFDFENRAHYFVDVHTRKKFCLLTLVGNGLAVERTMFGFFLPSPTAGAMQECAFPISQEQLARVNPLTRQPPVVPSRRDLELLLDIHSRSGSNGDTSPGWVGFTSAGTGDEWVLVNPERSAEARDAAGLVPLIEGKLIHQFDNRWATYEGCSVADVEAGLPKQSDTRRQDPHWAATARFFVPRSLADDFRRRKSRLSQAYGVYRDYTSASNIRTLIAALVPEGVPVQPLNGFDSSGPAEALLDVARLNSFAVDYIARLKTPDIHLNVTIFNQLPGAPLGQERWTCFLPSPSDWILCRSLELTYTDWSLSRLAIALGRNHAPFKWEGRRREIVRQELDAAYFCLFGFSREDVEYVLDTFPLVREADIGQFGEFRTKKRILELYDRMQRAMEREEAFISELNPPPGDVRAAHGAG